MVIIGRIFSGKASYYGGKDGLCGHKTANGGRLDCTAMTAAHRHLKFGTKVKVTHHHKSVVCVVNDRGPFIKSRVIDVSYGAAVKLNMIKKGVVEVVCEVLI